MRGHRDLAWSAIAAVVCALVAALVPWEIVRIVAALPLTLFLPGYAVVAVTFGSGELALPKRLTLSIGVSLMVLVLGALVLNAFPFGIRTASWAILLAAVTLAACRGAALRRDRPQPRGKQQRPFASFRPSWGSVALVATAVIIAGAALVLAQKPVPAKNAEGFTALWILPTNGSGDALTVGVISSEHDSQGYLLKIRVGRKGKITNYKLRLEPGEEQVFRVSVGLQARSQDKPLRVAASLYKRDRPRQLYRRVTTWLSPQEGG
jgi:uncharacterized membrane protein